MAIRNEHLVVVMLEPLPKGEQFETWPMHITIAPWFPVGDETKLDKLLSGIAKKHQKLQVKAGKIEEWGTKEKFNVIKITYAGKLKRLHWDIFRSLENNGYPVHQKDFMGQKYTPHITLRNSLADESKYARGAIIEVNRFSLVRQIRLKGSGRMIKSLVRDYELS